MPIQKWAPQGELRDYVGALKWGNGANPIHSYRGGPGRDTAPDPAGDAPPIALTGGDFSEDADYGYSDEDSSNCLYGYGVETGTADRASWGEDYADTQAGTGQFPQWGNYRGGIPGGTGIRTIEHGAVLGYSSKQVPDEDVSQGWEDKVHGIIEDSVTSDPSQYEMQTSMTQRDKTRAGSQASGTASDYDAPIRSRIIGQKLKTWTSPQSARHDEMAPKEQNLIVRPFRNRTAGTANPKLMAPNEMYVTTPMQRVPAAEPYQGAPVTQAVDVNGYGYVSEDYSTW